MNKKLICTLMVGTLLAGTVTGCGGSSYRCGKGNPGGT